MQNIRTLQNGTSDNDEKEKDKSRKEIRIIARADPISGNQLIMTHRTNQHRE